jgi:alpha-mannosidase
MTGRGKGRLAHESSGLSLGGSDIHITGIKKAEDGNGFIVRMFNPFEDERCVDLVFGCEVAAAEYCRLDEGRIGSVDVKGERLKLKVGPKKIVTVRVGFKEENRTAKFDRGVNCGGS